jgi:hypothetical protein
VHALLSLQTVPSVAFGLLQAPVAVLHTPTMWHVSRAVHTTGFAPVHVPAWHESACVHALLSVHVVPSDAFGLLQTPVVVLQIPATWHVSRAVHVTGFAPVQIPAVQVSVCVQLLLSLHAAPSALFGLEQMPVAGAHVPATWH